jgi:hypothetical protein
MGGGKLGLAYDGGECRLREAGDQRAMANLLVSGFTCLHVIFHLVVLHGRNGGQPGWGYLH